MTEMSGFILVLSIISAGQSPPCILREMQYDIYFKLVCFPHYIPVDAVYKYSGKYFLFFLPGTCIINKEVPLLDIAQIPICKINSITKSKNIYIILNLKTSWHNWHVPRSWSSHVPTLFPKTPCLYCQREWREFRTWDQTSLPGKNDYLGIFVVSKFRHYDRSR